MKTRRLTVAGAIVEFLKNQYVLADGKEHRLIEGVFGIFGHGNVAGLGQALEELGGRELPFFQPKNEQAMVHTAVAFAKTRKRLSTFACTTSVGPGATNLVTGAATATINRLPVLLLPGDIFANRIPAPVLQQLEYPQSMDVSVNDCLRPVSKYWDRINRPEQLLTALPEAMRVLASPAETGAVTICLPQDVQAEAYDFPFSFFEKRVYRQTRGPVANETLAEAVDLIRSAKRPMIVAGGGVHYSDAAATLQKFAETFGIPVAVTQAGKGVVAESHAQGLGAIGVTGTSAANTIATTADLVLCVGTRLADFTTASKTLFTTDKFIGLNISAMDAFKHGALPLVGDARKVLEQISESLAGYRVSSEFSVEIGSARAAWAQEHERIVFSGPKDSLNQAQVIRVLNQFCDENSTVVHAAGGIPGDIHKLWKSKAPGDYHSEYGFSCMGYEIAGSLGVKLASPAREVYAFLGDGSYLMLNHEIVTAVQEGLKITIVLNDNGGYQCIHGLQRSLGGASFGNEFRVREEGRLSGKTLPIDFPMNALSLGAVVFTARTETELFKSLEEAKKETKTCLIYVPIPSASRIPGYAWWDVPVSEVSESKDTTRARKNYEEKKTNQKFYY